MSTFAERYTNILKINGLKPVDAIEKTGVSKDVIYNLTSDKTAKKYDEVEKLFKICETPEQIIELATGKVTSKPPQVQNGYAEIVGVVRDLIEQVKGLKEEIRQMREDNKSAQVRLPNKIPEHH